MFRRVAATVVAAIAGSCLAADAAAAEDRSWTVAGPPDSHAAGLEAIVALEDGALSLSVRDDGRTVLEPAPVGVVTAEADLSSGLRPLDYTTRPVMESYVTTTGKHLKRRSLMQEARFAFAGADGRRMDLVVRVAADGVAYRYVLPDAATVLREASAFQPPATATAWLTDYSVNYERRYEERTAAAAPAGDYAYPALFQVGDSFVLLTESDVDGRYAGSRLVHQAGSARYDVALAETEIHSPGSLATPWRTAIVGELATVAESTLVDDLAPSSKVRDTSWIDPGTVAWSWLAGFQAAQRSLDTQKAFVDYSAAHGWEYVLVDDGWITTDWMPELIEYANRRGVEVLLWMHWTGLEGAEEREATLDEVKEWGAAGLKIDFMDSDSQERYQWYDAVLADTAERELLVNFHGSTIPHGIQRTWPHVMTMEAVRGAEQGNLLIDHITRLPFTRNVVGSMDYTPMGFQFGQRNTTDAGELALSVVYESGWQHNAGSIAAYQARPELERFLDQVPTVWDETQLLDGHPGDRVTFARRSGERWFVGSVVGGADRVQRVPLDFLDGGPWLVELVRDGADGLVRESRVMDRGDALEVPVTQGGGFVTQICRSHPGRETCDEPVDRVPLTSFTVEPERAAADPGQTVAFDARFAVDEFGPVLHVSVTATAPDGWFLEGAAARAGELGTGESLSASWSVTVPAEPEYGYTDIPVVAEFSVPGGPSGLRVEKLVRVFVSPPGVDYVSDLPFVSQRNGWGPVERDTSNGENQGGDGGPLRIRGTTFDKGLGVHAFSEVTVDIGGAYERFTAQVGLDDEVTGPGSVAFEVIGDGAVLARTGVLTRADPAQPIDVDVTGVETLTLRVTDGGDGINFDHGDWGDGQLRLLE